MMGYSQDSFFYRFLYDNGGEIELNVVVGSLNTVLHAGGYMNNSRWQC
jgi:hypothetical protein